MRIHKFETTEAFIAIDLEGAEASSGPARWAKKILQGGAKDLARSQTYTYAALGMKRGGAAAGICAAGRSGCSSRGVPHRSRTARRRRHLPARRSEGHRARRARPLHAADPRDTARLGDFADRCDGLSAVVAAHHAVGLDAKTIAIEGFENLGPWIADGVIGHGARLTAISTATGTVTNESGFSLAELNEAFAAHGADCVNELGEVGHPMAVFGAGADVVFAGSKVGIIDHKVAERLEGCAAVVPNGRLPLTARGLAVLKAGVQTPADFVALAGSTLAVWGDVSRSDDEIVAGVREDIGDLCAELQGHDDGLLLAACYFAEAFLMEWQDELRGAVHSPLTQLAQADASAMPRPTRTRAGACGTRRRR